LEFKAAAPAAALQGAARIFMQQAFPALDHRGGDDGQRCGGSLPGVQLFLDLDAAFELPEHKRYGADRDDR
jgi:hypothetical protein